MNGDRNYSILFGAVVALMSMLVLPGCAVLLGQDDGEKPDIVFILADDMRLDDFEHMPQTRQLLAEQGLEFQNAFVTHSLCCPSRASILRGQYTHNHQVLINNQGFEKFQSQGHEDSTVATWLKSGGYQTVLIGKYLNGYPRRNHETYVPPGWDEWYGRPRAEAGYYDYQLNENGTLVYYGGDEQDYYTDVLAGKAKDYVRRAVDDSRPFFMYLAPGTPHGPFIPALRHQNEYPAARAPQPPSFNEPDVADKPAWVGGLPRLTSADEQKADVAYRSRLRMLLSLDEMVAGLIEELEATSRLDNTYVFFTSDNGYHLGEHRLALGKRTAFEEAIRVPLLIRGPGVRAGTTVEEIALNIDLAPSFAELGDVSAPEFVDGRSLVPLFSGQAPPASWRSAFLVEHWSGGGGNPSQTPTYAAVRTGTHKYVEYENGEKELYDLSADPYELESFPETADSALLESLVSRLEALKGCAKQACHQAED